MPADQGYAARVAMAVDKNVAVAAAAADAAWVALHNAVYGDGDGGVVTTF